MLCFGLCRFFQKSIRAHRQKTKSKQHGTKLSGRGPKTSFSDKGFIPAMCMTLCFFSANAYQRVPVNEWKVCKFETPIATRRHKKYNPQKNRADRTNSRLFIRLSTCEPYWQSIAQTSFLDHAGPQPHALRSIQHHPLPIAIEALL